MATDQMIHVNAEKETHIDITSKYLNFSSRVYIVMLTSDAPVYEHNTWLSKTASCVLFLKHTSWRKIGCQPTRYVNILPAIIF